MLRPVTRVRASSRVRRIGSPPGTSPTPVLPSESVRTTKFRVKKGPCAPLRFSNMLSWPATGITDMSRTTGVLISISLRGEPFVAVGQRTHDTGYLVSHGTQRAGDLPFTLPRQPHHRHRATDGVLRGCAVTQRDGETPQPRRVLLVVSGVSPHPHVIEHVVKRRAVDDRARGERPKPGGDVLVAV